MSRSNMTLPFDDAAHNLDEDLAPVQPVGSARSPVLTPLKKLDGGLWSGISLPAKPDQSAIPIEYTVIGA
jgi:hypothetical protein